MAESSSRESAMIAIHHGDHPGTTGRHFAESAQKTGGRSIPRAHGRHIAAGELANNEHLVWVESGAASYPLSSWELDRASVGYMIDVHRHLWKTMLQTQLFDVVFVAQKEYVDALRSVHPSVAWLPLAAPKSFLDLERKPIFQVGFVGGLTGRPERECLLASANVHYSMNDWRRPHSVAAMADVYRRSRFVINPPIHRDLNMRAFEAMAAGAVLVTPLVPGLDDIGKDGVHFIVADFTSPAGPVEAVARAIDTREEADIGTAGRAAIAGGHTYDHRLATMVAAAAIAPRQAPIRSMSSTERGELYMRLAVSHRDVRLARYATHLSHRASVIAPLARAVVTATARRARGVVSTQAIS